MQRHRLGDIAMTHEPTSFEPSPDGVIRIGSTRVTLDTVVEAFCEGMTPEGIAEQYPSLSTCRYLFGYRLLSSSQRTNGRLLAPRLEQSDAVRRENERRFDPVGVRARLLARKPQE